MQWEFINKYYTKTLKFYYIKEYYIIKKIGKVRKRR